MAHLLLIEDAPEVATVVRILCRRAGHTFSWHADGASVADSPRPDLLLLDLNLAGEDGIELYRRLAQPSGPLAGVPAALFTQGAAPERIAAALDAGIDFIISKDLLGQPDEWNHRIAEVLELAAAPLEVLSPRSSVLSTDGLARALRHPVLLRLGDEVIAAMVRRVLSRFPPQSGVDVALTYANLGAHLTRLELSHPVAVAHLVQGLSRQAECLLGRDVSAPFRAALSAALS